MFGKIYKELIALILFFVVVWLAFIYIPFRPNKPEELITIEQEQDIGELLIESYLSQVELYDDSIINNAVTAIHNRLLEGLQYTEYDYNIYIVKNSEVNAFASLGGNIVIYTGLLDFANSPEEVAAVLAHEIGHVEKKHVVNKVVKELGVSIVLSVITGGDPGFLNEIIQQSISTVFDRSQENDADDYGLNLLENSKIHPNAMASIFRKIRDKYSGLNYDALEFLSTHPNTNKRIKKALEYQPSNDFKGEVFENIDWRLVQDTI